MKEVDSPSDEPVELAAALSAPASQPRGPRMAELQQATSELAAATDSRAVAMAIVRQAKQLGAVAGVMALPDPSGETLVVHESYDVPSQTDVWWECQPLTARTPMVEAFTRGVVVLVDNIARWRADYPDAAAHPIGPAGARIAMPLHAGDRVVGVVALVFDGDRVFDADDRAFYETFARQCSMAYERSCAFAELRRADREKDEFLAMLAHELRNPLTSVKLAVRMLRGSDPSAEYRERYLALIDRQTANLARLVDDVFDVSRVAHGTIELRREPLDLRAVVRRVEEVLFPTDEPIARQVSIALGAEPVWVSGDAVRLEQVVANVLSNALRYTDEGASIAVRLTCDERCARLSVCDNGVGMPRDALGRLVDPFAGGSELRARSRGGLGVGLKIVRRLVELHDGRIVARSGGLGCGTEIEIELPLTPAPAQQPATSIPVAARHLEHRVHRVLVVDDDDDARETMAEALAAGGHQVVTAANGVGAIETGARFAPDVVLLDVGLPDLDGYEVMKRLRARCPRSVMIAVTGFGQARDGDRARAAGFDSHLLKPIDLDVLETVIDGLCNDPPGRVLTGGSESP